MNNGDPAEGLNAFDRLYVMMAEKRLERDRRLALSRAKLDNLKAEFDAKSLEREARLEEAEEAIVDLQRRRQPLLTKIRKLQIEDATCVRAVEAWYRKIQEVKDEEVEYQTRLDAQEREHAEMEKDTSTEQKSWLSQQLHGLGLAAAPSTHTPPPSRVQSVAKEATNDETPEPHDSRDETRLRRSTRQTAPSRDEAHGNSDTLAPMPERQKRRATDESPGDRQQQRKMTRQAESSPHPTISFDEIYQDGTPDKLRMITEHPKDSNTWYIFRCAEHDLDFAADLNARDPILTARNHLKSRDHGQLAITRDLAVAKFGVRIWDCDAAKARLNNHLVENHRKNNPTPQTTKALDKAPHADACVGEGVFHPDKGHVYRCCISRKSHTRTTTRQRAVLLLPLGDFSPVGVQGALKETHLGESSNVPVCYQWRDDILVWAKGFEDDGPQVHERHFPVMLFDRDMSIPPQGLIKVPNSTRTLRWVPAKCLSPFDPFITKSKVGGVEAAKRYLQNLSIQGGAAHDGQKAQHHMPGQPKSSDPSKLAKPTSDMSPVPQSNTGVLGTLARVGPSALATTSREDPEVMATDTSHIDTDEEEEKSDEEHLAEFAEQRFEVEEDSEENYVPDEPVQWY